MTDTEFMFTAAITLPSGVRIDATAYVPSSEIHTDVLEALELVAMATTRAASQYLQGEKNRRSQALPF